MKHYLIVLIILLNFSCYKTENPSSESFVQPEEDTDIVVTVLPEITKFITEPETIIEGDSVRLIWKTEKAENVFVKFWDIYKQVNLSGSKIIYGINKDHEFKIKATNKDGTVYQFAYVKVNPDLSLPKIIYFKCNPNPVISGNQTYMSYKVEKAEKVYIKTWNTWNEANNKSGGWYLTRDTDSRLYIKAINKNGTVEDSFLLKIQ